ncbi:MAG: hypothetical protein D6702_05950 [Planctomycetota bacterium]|nr:MAG: hypothetical protein D6702_05950 [Planctomycetota bacterium]
MRVVPGSSPSSAAACSKRRRICRKGFDSSVAAGRVTGSAMSARGGGREEAGGRRRIAPDRRRRPGRAGKWPARLESARGRPQDGRMEQRDLRRFRPRRLPVVELDGGRILAVEPALPMLRRLGLDTVAGAVSCQRGELVRQAGRRRTRRLATEEGDFFLKVYPKAGHLERWLGWLVGLRSPGRREWDNIRLLRRAAFDVPEMVAVGEETAGPFRPGGSFLLLRGIEGIRLDHFLAAGWPQPPGGSAAAGRERVLRDLAGMVRRLHSNGFFHRDLYCGHLIVTPDERWGRPFLIDLQRVGQRFPPRRRWLVKDLAALAYSAPPLVSRSDRLRFLLHYLCKSRVDPLVRRWWRQVAAKVERMRRHRPRHP